MLILSLEHQGSCYLYPSIHLLSTSAARQLSSYFTLFHRDEGIGEIYHSQTDENHTSKWFFTRGAVDLSDDDLHFTWIWWTQPRQLFWQYSRLGLTVRHWVIGWVHIPQTHFEEVCWLLCSPTAIGSLPTKSMLTLPLKKNSSSALRSPTSSTNSGKTQ